VWQNEPWTQRQVEERRGRSAAALLSEWDERGATVDSLIPAFPEAIATQLLADAVTHEFDIRGALGDHSARDSEALLVVVPWAFGGLGTHDPVVGVTTGTNRYLTGESASRGRVRGSHD
jgi:hypothetical protein